MIEIIIGIILLWILSPSDDEIKRQNREDTDYFFLEHFDDYDEKNH
jgi:hypothetical protein